MRFMRAEEVGDGKAEDEPERACSGKQTKRVTLCMSAARAQEFADKHAHRMDKHSTNEKRQDSFLGRSESRDARRGEPGKRGGQDASGSAVVALSHIRLRFRYGHIHF